LDFHNCNFISKVVDIMSTIAFTWIWMVHSFILVILSNSFIAFELGGQIVIVGRRPTGELLLMISILP
jgi:hypothetical protein